MKNDIIPLKYTHKKTVSWIFIIVTLFSLLNLPAIASDTPTAEDTLAAYGLTPLGGSGRVQEITAAGLDGQNRLAVTAGGTSGNLFLGVPLGSIAGTLEEYTVEAKLTSIGLSDGWHYGIGWNNSQNNSNENWYSMRVGEYDSAKNNGELRCWVQKANGQAQGVNGNNMGKPGTAFESMSAANGTENIFSASVEKSGEGSKITFYMNGVEVTSVTDTVNEYTLLDFNIIIPYTTTVAISYMCVCDGDGNAVYNQKFASSSNVTHSLTVDYIYKDGTKAADSVVRQVAEGTFYNVSSPNIVGFVSDAFTVSGIMGSEDKTLTVVYSPVFSVTVHYVDSFGETVFADIVIDKLIERDPYCIESIPLQHYTVDKEIVEGIVEDRNIEITVTYTSTIPVTDNIESSEPNTGESESNNINGDIPESENAEDIPQAENTEDLPETEEHEKKEGCGSVISVIGIVPFTAFMSFVLAKRKKDD